MYSSLYTNVPKTKIFTPTISGSKIPKELDIEEYEWEVSQLNKKIDNFPNNASLYLERAILRDFNWGNELAYSQQVDLDVEGSATPDGLSLS